MADPTTVSELIDWFEREFCCMVGPARSWIEIPVWYGDTVSEHVIGRWYYQTWAVKIRDVICYEQKLVSAMFDDLKNVPRDDDAQTVLFWRFASKFILSSEQKQLYGAPICSQELIEDGKCVPPAGAIQQLETSNWFEDGGVERVWTLRTRLCINIPCGKYPPMLTRKAEGAETLMIGD